MSKATITLNSRNSALDMDGNQPVIYGQPIDTLTMQRAQYNGSLEINGEEFILLPASGRNNSFNRPPKIEAFKKGETGENTVGKAIEHATVSGILDALMPVHGLLEFVKMAAETLQHVQEGAGQKVDLTPKPININPKAAINPNTSFLPRSPFIIHDKPTPLLWSRVRNDVEEKKKKKKMNASHMSM